MRSLTVLMAKTMMATVTQTVLIQTVPIAQTAKPLSLTVSMALTTMAMVTSTRDDTDLSKRSSVVKGRTLKSPDRNDGLDDDGDGTIDWC